MGLTLGPEAFSDEAAVRPRERFHRAKLSSFSSSLAYSDGLLAGEGL